MKNLQVKTNEELQNGLQNPQLQSDLKKPDNDLIFDGHKYA